MRQRFGSIWALAESPLAPLLFLTVLVFAIFSNAIHGSFLWDDQQFILENRYMESWTLIPQFFVHNVAHGAGLINNLYRPIQELVHFLNLAIAGKNAEWHRFVNVTIHATSSAVWYLVFLRLLDDPEKKDRSKSAPRWASFFGALFLFTHPLQSEDVAYPSALGEILMLFFAGLSILSFRHGSSSGSIRKNALTFLFAALSILSKENGLLVPVFLFGYDWVICERTKTRLAFKTHAILTSIAVIYLGLRFSVLNFQNFANFYNAPNPLTEHWNYRVYTYLSTLPTALRLLIYPFDLHHERSWAIQASISSEAVLGGIAVVLAATAGAYFFRRSRLAVAAIAWFFIATLPSSNLFILINALFYDHWFIVPSIGFFLLCALALKQAFQKLEKRSNPAALALSLLLALSFAPYWAITWKQNQIWTNPISLYENILRFEPDSVKIMNNLAMTVAERNEPGDRSRAIATYQTAISLSDIYPQTHHNLGLAYLADGKPDLAEQELKRAIAMDPRFFPSYTWLGLLYLQQGHREAASKALHQSLAITPSAQALEALKKIESF